MKATTAVIIATVYLVVFYALLNFNTGALFTMFVYLSLPVVIIGMVFIILLDDSYEYPELPKNDEWGYNDKKKEDLWII